MAKQPTPDPAGGDDVAAELARARKALADRHAGDAGSAGGTDFAGAFKGGGFSDNLILSMYERFLRGKTTEAGGIPSDYLRLGQVARGMGG